MITQSCGAQAEEKRHLCVRMYGQMDILMEHMHFIEYGMQDLPKVLRRKGYLQTHIFRVDAQEFPSNV